MNCPCCSAAMNAEVLDTRLQTPAAVDFCLPCQAFWFDAHESLQLSPGAVLKLFRLIGEQALAARVPMSGRPTCPQCGIHLLLTHDQQRRTRFQYERCPRGHGRL